MRAAETLFVILLVCTGCGGGGAPAGGYAVEVRDDAANSATVQVELAVTPAERAKGLMDRQSLAADAGMLFLFTRPSAGGFWMKNTHIPLDIAYLAEDGTIQEIRKGVPLSEEPLRPVLPYLYVLEVNEGWFAAHGFGAGDTVVIPQDIFDAADIARGPPILGEP